MYCKNCGKKNDDDALYCRECGASLNSTPSVDDHQSEHHDLPTMPSSTEQQSLPMRHKRKWLLIGMLFVLMIAVVVTIGAFIYMNTGSRLAAKQVAQGDNYLNSKLYNQSVAAFEKAIKTDIKTTNAYTGLADAYAGLNNNKKAEQALQSAIIAIPTSEIFYIKLAEMYENDGIPETALQTLKSGYAVTKSHDIQTQIIKTQVTINTYGNSQGNIINNGFVTHQGNWIYYCGSKGNLYKIRTDGTGELKLNSDNCAYLNVVGDWVYYQNINYYSDGEFDTINKIRTDGTGEVELSKDYADCIYVVGNWIYYSNWSDKSSLYKIQTDGTGRTKLNNEMSDFINVVGDWVYYRSLNEKNGSSFIYKIKTDGSGKTQLNNDFSTCVNVVNDWIYYLADDGYETNDIGAISSTRSIIYKIRTNGTGRISLGSVVDIWSINTADDWVYYFCSNGIYKIRTDGTGKTELCGFNENCFYINVVGNWLYYGDDLINNPLHKILTNSTENQLVK